LDATEPDRNTAKPTREIRRPRHTASLNGDWRFLASKADLNVNVTYVGDQNDTFFEPVAPFGQQTVTLDSYYLASVAVSYRLTEQASIYGRVENLLDGDYEDVYGYNTPGIGAYAGIRLNF
jgi:vitamin B12 transporter